MNCTCAHTPIQHARSVKPQEWGRSPKESGKDRARQRPVRLCSQAGQMVSQGETEGLVRVARLMSGKEVSQGSGWSFSDSLSLLHVPENCNTGLSDGSAPSTTGEGHRSCRGDRALPVSVKSFHYPHEAHSASLLAKLLEAFGINRVLLRKEVRSAFVSAPGQV